MARSSSARSPTASGPSPATSSSSIDGLRVRLSRGDSARVVESARRRRGTHNEKRPYVVAARARLARRALQDGRDPRVPRPARRARVGQTTSRACSTATRAFDVERRPARSRAGRATARRVGAGAARPLARPARSQGSARTHVAGAVGRRTRQRPVRIPRARALGRDRRARPTTNRSCCTAAASPTRARRVDRSRRRAGRRSRRVARPDRSGPSAHAAGAAAATTCSTPRQRVHRRPRSARLRRRRDAREPLRRAADERQRGRRREPRTFGHVLVDEAQDLTPMQWRMLARPVPVGVDDPRRRPRARRASRARSASWDTMLSHLPIAQPAALRHAHDQLPHAGRGDGRRVAAARGRRHRPSSRRVSVRSTGEQPRFVAASPTELVAVTARHAARPFARTGTVAVIAPDRAARRDRRRARRHRRQLDDRPTRSTRRLRCSTRPSAKGLEFDHVVVVEPSELVTADRAGLRLLYVTITRTTKTLTVVHAEALPEGLAPSRP